MNWHDRIKRAEKRGFTQTDRDKAQNWFSCACGELDPRIPKNETAGSFGYGEPLDTQLLDLGQTFAGDVEEGNVEDAKFTLSLIERREAELLRRLRT